MKAWSTPKAARGGWTNSREGKRLTLEGEASNWATPRAEDSQAAGAHCNRIDSVNAQVKIWPTPRANSSIGGCQHGEGGPDLQTAVGKDWPTPCATDDIRGMNDYDGKRGQTLLGAVRGQPWATALQRDYKSGKGSKELLTRNSPSLSVQTENGEKGMLNPDWEETLMGWPVGWTNWTEPCAGLWPGFPMGQGPEQFDYEPPRTMPKGAVLNRTKRIEMIGNGVVWMCAAEAFYELLGGK